MIIFIRILILVVLVLLQKSLIHILSLVFNSSHNFVYKIVGIDKINMFFAASSEIEIYLVFVIYVNCVFLKRFIKFEYTLLAVIVVIKIWYMDRKTIHEPILL